MSVTQSLVTSNFNVINAQLFVDSIYNEDSSPYYMFVGKHTPYPNSDGAITVPNNSVMSTTIDIYNNMIFAKRIEASDIVHMIPKHLWVSNTVYDEYSHVDGDLINKSFYVVVDDSTEYNVYKCLNNNNGSPTGISPPARVGSSADLDPIITDDDYVWKYMYTINKTQWEKFSTQIYMPVIANTEVIENAVPGTIDVIKVIDGGAGYDHYITNAVFKLGDIAVGGINTIFGAPEDASPIDDFYQGCVLKITSGVGAEEYRKIINYEGAGTQKKFILDSPFTNLPSENDTYEVYPYVFVWGDGSESISAEGRALIDPVSNSIYTVEVLNPGKGYRSAQSYAGEFPSTFPITIDSIYIPVPEVVSQDIEFERAVLQPIISPVGGHGSDPWGELLASRVCVSVKFDQSENGVFPIDNDFRQVGIIKDPRFTNVTVNFQDNSVIGSFSIGESVYQYRQIRLYGNVSIEEDSSVIQKTDQGLISNTITILNGGRYYDDSANNLLIFDNSGTGGSGAEAIFTTNTSIIAQAEIESNSAITSDNFINFVDANTTFQNNDRVKYFPGDTTSGIDGLANGQYYYVVSANTTGFKVANSQDGTPLVITANTTDSGNVYFAHINGAITSVTVTNRGSNYVTAPTVTVNPLAANGASNAQFEVTIANPQETKFLDAFEVNDPVLVSDGYNNYVSLVTDVVDNYTITCSSNATFSADNAEISALVLSARGRVSGFANGGITLTDVSGTFTEGSKIIGLTNGGTAVIAASNSTFNAIELNDRSAGTFNRSLQLTKLVGDFTTGSSPFIKDEQVIQESLIAYAAPRGYVHHAEINSLTNDDELYISNEYGIFNLDPRGVRTIEGQSSGATLESLTAKYSGNFVKDSGKVIYFENLDAIVRSDNKSEIIKIVLEF